MGTHRKYGGDDNRTTAQRKADAEHRVLAILDVMKDDARYCDSPNVIVDMARRKHRVLVHQPHGHSGKRLGSGSSYAPVFTALRKRRLIAWKSRDDGLSGSAFCITRAGREFLALPENQEILRTYVPVQDVRNPA